MNSNKTYKSCIISNEEILLNNELFYEFKGKGFAKFIKNAYKNLNISYPKFHKMDRLCKLAFVGASVLLEHNRLDDYESTDIALVIANAKSTYHTDSKHASSIKDANNYFPSPAVFVYTLPNILVGEICIRYNIKGQSVFFVEDKFDREWMINFSKDMISAGDAKICLTGWCDYTEENYLSELYLITN